LTGPIPTPVVPVPAAAFSGLRGRRVVIGVPGVGFRNDLRADNPVVQGDRTYVPVLTEQDYYRAESQGTEAFATLVPIERVWVEETPEVSNVPVHNKAALDAPPACQPLPSAAAGGLIGRRVVQRVPDGFIRNLRATTSLYLADDGQISVQVCGEAEWYQWAATGSVPRMTKVESIDLWVE
jgi:hypothetical protein